MAAGFSWVCKTHRRSCHRRNDSGELDIFEANHYFSTTNKNPGHRGATPSQKLALATTRQAHGSTNIATSRENWRELGRVSLDMPMMRHTHHHHHHHHTLSQSEETFLDTITPTKNNKKKHKPSSPGGRLASFFNSLISQAVSKKKKPSKSSPQSIKDLVEEETASGWRRRRRSSISHFRRSTSSFSTAFASHKPNSITPSTRSKRTSMSDIDAKSINSCPSVSGFLTPPPYMSKNTHIKPTKRNNNICSNAKESCGGNLDWLDEKLKMVNGSSTKRKEFMNFVEEDAEGSDSSSDLFELKLNYDDHHELGYCEGGLPVYESTNIDSIKIAYTTPITNGPFKNT